MNHSTALLGLLLITLPAPLVPECIGCMTPHIDTLPSGESAEFYVKKCRAKQKHIEGDFCPFCKCPKALHSIHKHPYKMHNGRKLSELPIETILPPAQTEEEKAKAIKNLLTQGKLPAGGKQ